MRLRCRVLYACVEMTKIMTYVCMQLNERLFLIDMGTEHCGHCYSATSKPT